MTPPLIALEEHFISGFFEITDDLHTNVPGQSQEKLKDIGEGRIKDLDNGATRLQVISHIAAPTPVQACIDSNDKLAAACRKYPDRLAGFATLPMQDPQAAAQELERAVTSLGFLGALINNTCEDGSMYDDEKYWPVFERATELDVPVYIHPSYPPDNMTSHYKGNFAPMAAIMMSTAGFGWHAECGLQVLRLFASGLFDRFPKLKLVIGHMGELLPYTLDRTIHTSRHWGKMERDLRTVWR